MTTPDAFQTAGSSPPEKIAGYRIHPAANLFPLMSEPELQALADDIKKNGQYEPILFSGPFLKRKRGALGPEVPDPERVLIIDGRNRLLACEMAGRAPSSAEA